MKSSYLNMLVMSIPTNITFTGNQTLINLHVSGSVETTPKRLNIETIATEIKFCTSTQVSDFSMSNFYIIKLQSSTGRENKQNT